MADNKWHHLVWTRDSDTGESCIVIDGDTNNKKCATNSRSTGAIEIDENGLILGQEQDAIEGGFTSDQAFDGYMDELKIFRKILNNDDIEDIYKNESLGHNYYESTTRECRMCILAEYRMDDCIWNGETDEVADNSGHNYHGIAYDMNNELNSTVGGMICKVGDFTQQV